MVDRAFNPANWCRTSMAFPASDLMVLLKRLAFPRVSGKFSFDVIVFGFRMMCVSIYFCYKMWVSRLYNVYF